MTGLIKVTMKDKFLTVSDMAKELILILKKELYMKVNGLMG